MVSSISEEVEVQQLLPLKPHQFIKQEMLDSAMKKRGNSYNSNENPDGKSSEDDNDDYKKELMKMMAISLYIHHLKKSLKNWYITMLQDLCMVL